MADVEETSIILVEVEVAPVQVTEVDQSGVPGEQGGSGWSPVLAVVADGERRVYQVANWEGGEGVAPPVGQYIGASGFVSDIAQAVDIRGTEGAQGIQGERGLDGAPGAVVIGEGAEILTGEGAPSDDIGADNQLYLDTVTGDLYKKEAGTWGEPIANIRGPQGPQGVQGANGAAGANGAQGLPGTAGWSPIFAVYSDGARRVLRVTDWTGGAGTKPATGGFVGVSGIVTLPADAVDIRGPQGADGANGLRGEKGDKGNTGDQGIQGPAGSNGWLPILAAAADGERRVFQVTDWQGGTGTKPATGGYLGASGIVTDIAEATDVRGAQGAQGTQGVPGEPGAPGTPGEDGEDGADGATFNPAGEWNSATNYAAHSLVSEDGSSYTNANPSINERPSTNPDKWTMVAEKGEQGIQGIQGPQGNPGTAGEDGTDGSNGGDGVTPVVAVIEDGDRRVMGIVDFVEGPYEGTLPIFVTSDGNFTTNPAAVPDLRGPQGEQGIQGEKGDKGDKGDAGSPGSGGGGGSPISSINFTFDGQSTAASDPGSGKFRFNFTGRTNAPGNFQIYVSATDKAGTDQTSLFDAMPESDIVKALTMTIRGLNGYPYSTVVVNSITKNSGWYTLGVEFLKFVPAGTDPLYDATEFELQFSIDTYPTGVIMPTPTSGSFNYVPPGLIVAKKGTLALTANRMYVHPARFKEPWRTVQAILSVATAPSSAMTGRLRFLIYRAHENYPTSLKGGELVMDSGTANLAAVTGKQGINLNSSTLMKPGLYLLCLAVSTLNGAPVLNTLDGWVEESWNVDGNAGFQYIDGYYVAANKVTSPDSPWASTISNTAKQDIPATVDALYKCPFMLLFEYLR